jgi:hypothetical protein
MAALRIWLCQWVEVFVEFNELETSSDGSKSVMMPSPVLLSRKMRTPDREA